MKSTLIALAAALAATEVAAHATFQDLWINNVDQGQTCVRLPQSNSPITNVASNDIRCNVNGAKGVTGRCAVKVGDTVTVEMHQQGGDRNCATEAIGGAHYGPVHVYLSKVSDARTADGSAGWFKVFANTWSKGAGSSSGDNDNWGNKDMNKCCGHVDFKIPAGIANGDYLVRAETIALHTAGSSGGAQFYVSCYQITVSGGGTTSPPTVQFPGAYKASDPGILVNIHGPLSTYVDPGPTVWSGAGAQPTAGSGCKGYASASKPVVQPTLYAGSGKRDHVRDFVNGGAW